MTLPPRSHQRRAALRGGRGGPRRSARASLRKAAATRSGRLKRRGRAAWRIPPALGVGCGRLAAGPSPRRGQGARAERHRRARPRRRPRPASDIVDSEDQGNEFRSPADPDAERDETHAEAELIEEDCVAQQGSEPLRGATPGRPPGRQDARLRRRSDAGRDLLARDWPRAWRPPPTLAARAGQRCPAPPPGTARSTARPARGCSSTPARATSERSAPATAEDADGPVCDGELLPDGRCRRYRFARLPLLPAR